MDQTYGEQKQPLSGESFLSKSLADLGQDSLMCRVRFIKEVLQSVSKHVWSVQGFFSG